MIKARTGGEIGIGMCILLLYLGSPPKYTSLGPGGNIGSQGWQDWKMNVHLITVSGQPLKVHLFRSALVWRTWSLRTCVKYKLTLRLYLLNLLTIWRRQQEVITGTGSEIGLGMCTYRNRIAVSWQPLEYSPIRL
jgi:hypothetical protein